MTEPVAPVEPDASQVLTTETEPAILGPTTRILRTVLQVVAALIVAVPAAAQAFNMTEANAAKVTTAMGVLTVLASVLHNLVDIKKAPVVAKDVGQVSLRLLLMILAIVCLIIFALAAHGSIRTEEAFTWLGAGLVFWAIAEIVP